MTAWLVVPEPTAWLDVEVKVASVGLVPHSNQALVARPFGFTLPFNLAPVVVIEVAALVVTVGARAVVTKQTDRTFRGSRGAGSRHAAVVGRPGSKPRKSRRDRLARRPRARGLVGSGGEGGKRRAGPPLEPSGGDRPFGFTVPFNVAPWP